MKRVMAGLMAGAVWLLAAPAFGQQPERTIEDLTEEQMNELYCVYDDLGLFADIGALTDAYMSGDPDSAAYKEQMADVESSAADCSDDYAWADDETTVAELIGLYGVMGDELERRMRESGLKDVDFTAFYDTVDAMSDADIDVFADGAWAGHDDVADRFVAALKVKGLTSDVVMRNAIHLAEAYILASLLTREWLAQTPAS